MRNRRRSDRRVFLTRRIGIVAAPGTAHGAVSAAPSGAGQRGLRRRRLPRPAEERRPRLSRRPVAVLQPRVHVVGRLAPQLREPGRLQRLLAGRPLGQRLELEERRQGRSTSRWTTTRRAAPSPGGPPARPARRAATSRGCRPVSDNAITIEEYNYLHAGMYDTRTISSSSSMWPSGFIHIKDTVVRNTQSPTVSGTAAGRDEGQDHQRQVERDQPRLRLPVARQRRRRSPAPPPSRSSPPRPSSASACAPRSPPRSRARTPGSATSPPTDSVARGVFTNTAAPTITGTPQVGVQLSASTGTWTPAGELRVPLVRRRHPDHRRRRVDVHPDRGRARQADQGQGQLGAATATRPSTVRSERQRPGRPRTVPRHGGADDLRYAAGRPGPHRHPRHLDARPAGSTCSGWPTASRSRAPPGRRTR